MGNVRKCARKFVIENDLNKSNYEMLEKIINNLGFTIVRFNKGSLEATNIFNALNLDESTRCKRCFSFIGGEYKQVFLANYLSAEENEFMLLHEIGHVKLGHLTKNNVYAEELDEKEAHEFAFTVLWYIKFRNARKKFISLFTWAIAAVMLSYVTISILHIRSDNSTDNSSTVSDRNAYRPAEPLPQAISDTDSHTEEDQTFYVTSSGEKYHKETCAIIKNKTNVFHGTQEELESLGYEPCKLCIGE